MGIELELFVLLILSNLGQILFARFEIETPRWRGLLKWTIVHGGTLGLFHLVGHWSLLLPAAAVLLGLIVHVTWCRRHQIDALTAEPLARYYELRAWPWPPGTAGSGG